MGADAAFRSERRDAGVKRMTKTLIESEDYDQDLTEQRRLGLSLYGNKVRFNHLPPGNPHKCTKIYANGMVEIEGYSGIFAPHLFTIEEVIQISVERQVQ